MNTIYEQVGGGDVVRTAVTVFYNRVVDDESLAHWFKDVDMARLKAHQRAFLAAALEGPKLFAGRDLAEAHAGLDITDEAFDSIVVHLMTALHDLEVDPSAIERVGVRLESLRTQVVAPSKQP